MKRSVMAIAGIGMATSLILGGCSAGSDAAQRSVTLDFSQWWEVELKEGVMRDMMDRFEAENPGIKVNLISNPTPRLWICRLRGRQPAPSPTSSRSTGRASTT